MSRVWAVRAVLLLVLGIAVPYGPVLGRVAAFLYPKLIIPAIDVSNTPLTPDMMLMFDARYQKSLYLSKLDVVWETAAGDVTVPWKELPFYSFRVPLILFVEQAYWNKPHAADRHALCRRLKELRGPGTSFRVDTDMPAEIASASGLNRSHPCP